MSIPSNLFAAEIANQLKRRVTRELQPTNDLQGARVITSDNEFLHETSESLDDHSGEETATLLNAPVAGDPAKWIAINDNGQTLYLPAWAVPPS